MLILIISHWFKNWYNMLPCNTTFKLFGNLFYLLSSICRSAFKLFGNLFYVLSGILIMPKYAWQNAKDCLVHRFEFFSFLSSDSKWIFLLQLKGTRINVRCFSLERIKVKKSKIGLSIFPTILPYFLSPWRGKFHYCLVYVHHIDACRAHVQFSTWLPVFGPKHIHPHRLASQLCPGLA